MQIQRFKSVSYGLFVFAFSMIASTGHTASEYKITSVGKSAHEILNTIAKQSNKGMVINAPDVPLTINIASDTAYSAVLQVANDASYRMRYQNDSFQVGPVLNEKQASAKKSAKTKKDTFSLTLRDTPVVEAFEMLAKRGRVNLVLAPDVSGTVSANLYDIDLAGAIDNVAKAAGLVVSRNAQGIYVSRAGNALTAALQDSRSEVESFKIQYSDVTSVEGIMREYLSDEGSITSLPNRRMIIVRDTPTIIRELRSLLKKIDMQPRQILIEAKILEITLTEEETFGIDWQATRADTEFGTLALANRNTAGLFLNLLGNDLNAYLSALSTSGRVRTLSTPKLLVLEDQDAEVIVGDKLGYKVVTTNGVSTTESVEFLDSGIILRVKASVDGQDRILLDVHPEVSNGSLVGGLPVQKTTEVSTHLLANSGEEIFIGGLIRRTKTDNVSGVPGVSDVPVLGNLFKKTEDNGNRTETVVIIKPRIVHNTEAELDPMADLLESDSWFYETLPPIDLVFGCVNNRCGF